MSFTLYHLMIERSWYRSGLIPVNDHSRHVVKTKPNYDTMMDLIYRVGSPSNWHLRRDYFEVERIAKLKKLLSETDARLFVFKEHQETVGFCQVLSADFTHVKSGKIQNIVEIYKFGLFPDKIGQGRGRYFLGCVLDDLFTRYDGVYLNTRDTNHVKSVPFYQRIGFRVFDQEVCEDDLIAIEGSAQA